MNFPQHINLLYSYIGFLPENRNKKWDHATKKKEAKLAKKLKVLEKRKDKRTKRKIKLPQSTEIKKEKNVRQSSPKSALQKFIKIRTFSGVLVSGTE